MTLSQYQGCLVGLAVGDALGYPTEFRSRAQILSCFGPDGVTDFVSLKDARWVGRPIIIGPDQPPGTYSDDTQMTLALAYGLLDTLTGDLNDMMNAVADHFVAWSKSEDNNRAPGGTCMTGCERLNEGTPWQRSGVAQSKGCGSAMRVAPIGLLFANDHNKLLEVARASSIMTHGHDAAIEGAASAALLVALALNGASLEQMYDAIEQTCCAHSADFAMRWRQLPEMLSQPPEVALSNDGLGESWVAEEAVASAYYCVYHARGDFERALTLAANTDGDSDSIACIAGGIIGAQLGLEAIRPSWRQQVENSAHLHDIGQRLFDAASAKS